MNESFVVELWELLKEYSDRKHLSIVSEKYVDLLVDHGISDQSLENALGHDDDLDDAIRNVLDIFDEDDDVDDGDYDYDDE